jgi:hypothetical protein
MKSLLNFSIYLVVENETWEPVFKNKDTNYMFNFFIYFSK